VLNREDEAGFTLVEVGVALAIFATIVIGLTASLLTGLQLVGRSSARQNAVQIASRSVEELRAVPFSELGHNPAPSGSGAPAGDPDASISGSNYTVPAPNSITEPLAVNSAYIVKDVCTVTNCILHKEDVTTENVKYTVYRFVTVPASQTARKRVSVTVTWTGSGSRQRVDTTTLVTSGVLAWGA
jgi:Tfp pilus assembly protein PilV